MKSKKKEENQKVWMTLSKAETPIDKQIALTDIIKSDSNKQNAKLLWNILSKNGFYLHKDLEKKYRQQKTCFFCGGQIVKINGIDEKNYEERCDSCHYIYLEK